jgi:hypothetical protein
MQFQTTAAKGMLCGSTRASTCKQFSLFGLLHRDFLSRIQHYIALLLSVLLLKLQCCCSEKVTVPASKPNITFQGQGFDLTAIAWNDTAKSANGTFYSASVSVFASGFIAKNISFIVTA